MMSEKYRTKCFNHYGYECKVCGSDEDIHVHHVNGDREDNSIENLMPLCISCHMKVHRGVDQSEEIADIRSHLPDDSVVPYAPRSKSSEQARLPEPTYKAAVEESDRREISIGAVIELWRQRATEQ